MATILEEGNNYFGLKNRSLERYTQKETRQNLSAA